MKRNRPLRFLYRRLISIPCFILLLLITNVNPKNDYQPVADDKASVSIFKVLSNNAWKHLRNTFNNLVMWDLRNLIHIPLVFRLICLMSLQPLLENSRNSLDFRKQAFWMFVPKRKWPNLVVVCRITCKWLALGNVCSLFIIINL